MEFTILNTLGFDIAFPTSYRFLERYCRILNEDENTFNFSQYILELAMLDLRMN
jgi:hypothetical protein